MIKLTFYNNDVITSDTIDSTAALHDVEATLYACDLNGFTTKNPCSSETSVLYCLSNKYFKAIFNALNSELPLIAANKFLKRSSVFDVTDLDSIEEHIYTIIVSFVYLLIIELLYGKISAGRLLWMSEHY